MKRKQKNRLAALAFTGCAALALMGAAQVNSKVQALEAADAQRAATANHAVVMSCGVEPEKEPVYFAVPLDDDLQAFIFSECAEKGIDPAIIVAMIERESYYTVDAVGDNGNSFGLMQIQPRWHYQRMCDLDCTDLLDAKQNVTVGIDLLADLLERYNGDMGAALTAYNSGSYKGTVTEYAQSVINRAESLKAGEPL